MCRSPLAYRDVDARVPRQQVEHVIEEADAGRDRRAAGPVEIDLDLHVGFLGLALYGGFAHFNFLAISFTRAPFIRGGRDSPQSLRGVCKRFAPCLDDADCW